MDLEKKLEQIKPYQLNCSVFSVYDYDECTIQELLCRFFETINNCVDLCNNVLDLCKWLVSVGLEQEVAKKLDQWLQDGTIESLINEKIFKELNDKLNLNIEDVNNLKSHTFGWLSVKSFGAIGDGVNDDTDSIQSCFDYVSKHGGAIYFPRGKYKVTRPIRVYFNFESENKRPKIQKIFGDGCQSFEGIYDSTVIEGHNIPAHRGVLEILGTGNTFGGNTKIEDLGIIHNENCNEKSYCMFVGDSNQFEFNKVKMNGYNCLLLRSGSNLNTTSTSYACINMRIINSVLKVFENTTKGFSIFNEGLITNKGGLCDNILIESCMIQGLCVFWCVMLQVENSHIALRIPQKIKTTDNEGQLNGIEVDYSTGFLLVGFTTASFKQLYCEDYRRCLDVYPLKGNMGTLNFDNCYFNARSNQPSSVPGKNYVADYAILLRKNPSNPQWMIKSCEVNNCISRENDYREDFEFNKSFIENHIAQHLKVKSYRIHTDKNVKVINHVPTNYEIYKNVMSPNRRNLMFSYDNLQNNGVLVKFNKYSERIKMLNNSYITGCDISFSRPLSDDEDFALVIYNGSNEIVCTINKFMLEKTSDGLNYSASKIFNTNLNINENDEIYIKFYSVTLNILDNNVSIYGGITLSY